MSLLVLERFPISSRDVAGQAKCDLATTEHFLERLKQSGRLEWTEAEGYRRGFALVARTRKSVNRA